MNCSTVMEDLGIPRSNRFAGAALIPVDDGEALLERRIEVAEERRLARARPAVQEDQRRIGGALATYHLTHKAPSKLPRCSSGPSRCADAPAPSGSPPQRSGWQGASGFRDGSLRRLGPVHLPVHWAIRRHVGEHASRTTEGYAAGRRWRRTDDYGS